MPKSSTAGTSVYAPKDKKVWYISFRDPTQPQRYRSKRATPFRTDDPEGLRKAHAMAADLAKEARIVGDGAVAERWESWVISFLDRQYAKASQALTLKRYTGAWKWIYAYLVDEASVRVPRALTYQHVRGYVAWRTGFKKKSGKQVSVNTALDDVKVLLVVMNEAVRRDWANKNPCTKLGIQRDEGRHARELTADELARIEAALPAWVSENREERGWMTNAYWIGRFQGCRLRETRINLKTEVDLRADRLILHTKGYKDGAGHVTLLHPRLKPMLERLIREGHTWTLDYGSRPSILWRRFFDSIGLRDAWFHCLRSTVITEMARSGIPISQAMRYVLHANEEIHRAYQRLTTSDLRTAAAAIGGQPIQAATDDRMQAAVLAELVRGGMTFAEALQRVGHGVSAPPPSPASSSPGTPA